MQFAVPLFALAAVAYATPQASSASGDAVTAAISPTGSAPAGAQTSYPGAFEITIVNITLPTKRDVVQKRQSSTCGQAGYLTVTLANSQLTDSQGRTGYIASNYQFQFDKPPQAGALYTAGFSVLQNGSLALGPSAVFYECYTGGYYNLYDRYWAPQCEPILIDILPCSDSSSAGVSQTSDGQPQATTIASQPVSQISDGQPQATTAVPRPISQISDGQIQQPTGAPVSQISDGQIQATSAASQAPVSQISDGQIQATSVATKATSTGAVVTQIGDGQIQAGNATSTPAPFTGAGNALGVANSMAAIILGAAAVLLL